jgi:hypothetical protein
LRPAQANRLQDPISKITRAKWTESVAQAVEASIEALSSNLSPVKKSSLRQHYSLIRFGKDTLTYSIGKTMGVKSYKLQRRGIGSFLLLQ